MVVNLSAHKEKSTQSQLPVLRTVNNHHAPVVDYRTYRLSNRSLPYDKTVSSLMAKLVKIVNLQMNAKFS